MPRRSGPGTSYIARNVVRRHAGVVVLAIAITIVVASLARREPVAPSPPQLAMRAPNRPTAAIRELAADVGDPAEQLARWSSALQHATTCEERASAIAKLRALSDRRAIGALRRAARSACVEQAAREAIAQLEARS